ncbi:hypothetical protein HY448_01590 [Candidatus Pacearchaeota archaeon]|nr:hypothetical protein [Candidatus Pacearchaeota archaeon]
MKTEMALALMMGLFVLPVVIAEENSTSYDYENLGDFMNDIPSLNEKLQSESIQLPGSAAFLLSNGNLHISVAMNNGSSSDFYFTVEEKMITGIREGKPEKSDYELLTDEKTIQKILDSENKVDSILESYDEDKVELSANGFTNKVKLFFAKILLMFT